MPAAIDHLLGFSPTISVQLVVVTVICLLRLPALPLRFVLALLVLAAPAFCPSRGLLSTFFTGESVVIACRIADLSRFGERNRRGALLAWLICPVVRTLPKTPQERAAERRRAPRILVRAAAKRLAWEPLGWLQLALPPSLDHVLLRSTFLIFYFVLNLTALCDLVIFGARLAGARTDELFDWPLLARSPRDFWSRRWNRFISRFALKHVALPLTGKLPVFPLTLLVFAVSGIFHEYFAWGASGERTVPLSMMAFFLIQGCAVAWGQRWPTLQRLPSRVTHVLTFLWMTLTSPLFFRPLAVPLLAFGVKPEHLPWTGPALDWLPFF
jgi:hypothetical protein